MIIDLITNSEDIVKFVKENEGCGDIEDRQPKAYIMPDIQIGFLDDFYEKVEKFITVEGLGLLTKIESSTFTH